MIEIPFRKNGALNTALCEELTPLILTELGECFVDCSIQQLVFHYINKIEIIPSCICGDNLHFNGFAKGYSATCKNRSCRNEVYKMSLFKKHGVDNVFKLDKVKSKIAETINSKSEIEKQKIVKKRKETNFQRLGVEHPTQCTEVIKLRRSNNLEKYGVVSPNCLASVQEKIKLSNFKKYGVEYPSQRKEVKQKSIDTRQQTEDTLFPGRIYLRENFEKVIDRYNELKNLTLLTSEIDVDVQYLSRRLRDGGIVIDKTSQTSSIEKQVGEFLESLGQNVEYNNRKAISPKEIDLLVNDKLAIEINGIYWHSYKKIETTEQRQKHLIKAKLCLDKGLDQIQFTDLEWFNKQEILKSLLKSKLGLSQRIFARKTKIVNPSKKEVKRFLIENHLQGYCPSSIEIGLNFNDELIGLMTFGKSRFNKSIDFELLRLCFKKDIIIIGGANKMFKHFVKNFNGSIISYSDIQKFSGKVYAQLGFSLLHTNGPGYQYTDMKQMMSRIKYQKHKQSDIFENFNETLSEAENCFNNGLRRYWDCGTSVWIFKK